MIPKANWTSKSASSPAAACDWLLRPPKDELSTMEEEEKKHDNLIPLMETKLKEEPTASGL